GACFQPLDQGGPPADDVADAPGGTSLEGPDRAFLHERGREATGVSVEAEHAGKLRQEFGALVTNGGRDPAAEVDVRRRRSAQDRSRSNEGRRRRSAQLSAATKPKTVHRVPWLVADKAPRRQPCPQRSVA